MCLVVCFDSATVTTAIPRYLAKRVAQALYNLLTILCVRHPGQVKSISARHAYSRSRPIPLASVARVYYPARLSADFNDPVYRLTRITIDQPAVVSLTVAIDLFVQQDK
ncbi:hypothetical protein OUZ56_000714 [Daphnia magna]|uniref:Uncharacterized protein n=1 Tax=Daphnia magna TaxID=35525 RepID=A0ABR0A196_9CRUS|nr:hypothetical protein OUZ56_000714 [Daphnia magna]